MEPTKFTIRRRRTPLGLMLYGVYVYLCATSLRRTSAILEPVIERSHEAVRQWVRRLAPVCDGLAVERRLVGSIFVDETMIKVKGKQAWVWVAYEPRLRLFLSFRISYNRSVPDAYLFLKELRIRYGRRTIWTDEATFYPDACRWARLEHSVYPLEWKNQIERMNQALKDRLECFDDLFPCLREDCDREHVNDWIRVFRFYHNNRVQAGRTAAPEHQRFIRTIADALT